MTRYIITIAIVSFLSVTAGYTTGYVDGWEIGLRTGQADALMKAAGAMMQHIIRQNIGGEKRK